MTDDRYAGQPSCQEAEYIFALVCRRAELPPEIQAAPVRVKQGKQLTQEGQTGHKAFVLQSGWACSYKDLHKGTRQIISFPIAGDCVGLRSILLKTADHSFSALTDAVVSSVEGDHIRRCVIEYPRLGTALLWAASRDEAMVVEHPHRGPPVGQLGHTSTRTTSL
jgi:CRP-like cAMP-binding protein